MTDKQVSGLAHNLEDQKTQNECIYEAQILRIVDTKNESSKREDTKILEHIKVCNRCEIKYNKLVRQKKIVSENIPHILKDLKNSHLFKQEVQQMVRDFYPQGLEKLNSSVEKGLDPFKKAFSDFFKVILSRELLFCYGIAAVLFTVLKTSVL
jgi:hypothetical protein